MLNCFVNSTFGLEDYIENVIQFEVNENDIYGNGRVTDPDWAMVSVDHNWEYKI